MSTRTDLTINVLNNVSGKKTTNKISYVNPNISNTQAVTLANMITDLTKDTYHSTTRTDTTDCDNSITLNPELHYVCKNESGEYVSPTIPTSGVINILTSRVYAQTLTITIGNVGNIAMPHILNLTDSDTTNPVQMTETKLSSSGWWTISFQTSPKSDITARTVNLTLHFDDTTQYDAYNKTITFNITAE